MEIREASKDDIPDLNRVIRGSFRDVAERFALTAGNCPNHPSLCTVKWLRAAMDKGTRFFIMEGEEGAHGCVALESAGSGVCYLERLAVLPAERRRGYGESLVRHALEQARTAGAESVRIGIIAAQEELRDWYLRIGFEEMATKNFVHLPFEVAFMDFRL